MDIGRPSALGVLCGLMLLFSMTQALAQNPPAGTVQNAIGTLVVIRPDGIEERVQGMMALPLFEWDVVRTESSSQALIDLTDGMQVAVNENSVFRVLGRSENTKGITRIV